MKILIALAILTAAPLAHAEANPVQAALVKCIVAKLKTDGAGWNTRDGQPTAKELQAAKSYCVAKLAGELTR